MLVIRLQRTGRKGHAQFRVVVQDSRRTPTSGNVVAQIGNYDPHSKAVIINKERAQHYLDHGAQPTSRVVVLFKNEGLKLPAWIKLPVKQEGQIRHADKLRRNQPKVEAPVVEAEAPAVEEAVTEEAAPVEEPTETTEEATKTEA